MDVGASAHRPTRQPDDDAVLVARACTGDDDAFAELFRRHAAYVRGVAFRLLGDTSEVDDIVQETFIQATGGLATVHSPEHVRAWLVRIAVRRVHRRIRRRHRRRLVLAELAKQAPIVADPRDRARAEALYEALDAVPATMRIPWVLQRIEGYALEEVALACDTSLATVKRRIAKADAKLERRLRD